MLAPCRLATAAIVIVVYMMAGVCCAAETSGRTKLAVLDIGLIGDLGDPRLAEEHEARQQRATARLRQALGKSRFYTVVDDTPARPMIERAKSLQHLHACNGCELDIARDVARKGREDQPAGDSRLAGLNHEIGHGRGRVPRQAPPDGGPVALTLGSSRTGHSRDLEPGVIGQQAHQPLADETGCAKDSNGNLRRGHLSILLYEVSNANPSAATARKD